MLAWFIPIEIRKYFTEFRYVNFFNLIFCIIYYIKISEYWFDVFDLNMYLLIKNILLQLEFFKSNPLIDIYTPDLSFSVFGFEEDANWHLITRWTTCITLLPTYLIATNSLWENHLLVLKMFDFNTFNFTLVYLNKVFSFIYELGCYFIWWVGIHLTIIFTQYLVYFQEIWNSYVPEKAKFFITERWIFRDMPWFRTDIEVSFCWLILSFYEYLTPALNSYLSFSSVLTKTHLYYFFFLIFFCKSYWIWQKNLGFIFANWIFIKGFFAPLPQWTHVGPYFTRLIFFRPLLRQTKQIFFDSQVVLAIISAAIILPFFDLWWLIFICAAYSFLFLSFLLTKKFIYSIFLFLKIYFLYQIKQFISLRNKLFYFLLCVIYYTINFFLLVLFGCFLNALFINLSFFDFERILFFASTFLIITFFLKIGVQFHHVKYLYFTFYANIYTRYSRFLKKLQKMNVIKAIINTYIVAMRNNTLNRQSAVFLAMHYMENEFFRFILLFPPVFRTWNKIGYRKPTIKFGNWGSIIRMGYVFKKYNYNFNTFLAYWQSCISTPIHTQLCYLSKLIHRTNSAKFVFDEKNTDYWISKDFISTNIKSSAYRNGVEKYKFWGRSTNKNFFKDGGGVSFYLKTQYTNKLNKIVTKSIKKPSHLGFWLAKSIKKIIILQIFYNWLHIFYKRLRKKRINRIPKNDNIQIHCFTFYYKLRMILDAKIFLMKYFAGRYWKRHLKRKNPFKYKKKNSIYQPYLIELLSLYQTRAPKFPTKIRKKKIKKIKKVWIKWKFWQTLKAQVQQQIQQKIVNKVKGQITKIKATLKTKFYTFFNIPPNLTLAWHKGQFKMLKRWAKTIKISKHEKIKLFIPELKKDQNNYFYKTIFASNRSNKNIILWKGLREVILAQPLKSGDLKITHTLQKLLIPKKRKMTAFRAQKHDWNNKDWVAKLKQWTDDEEIYWYHVRKKQRRAQWTCYKNVFYEPFNRYQLFFKTLLKQPSFQNYQYTFLITMLEKQNLESYAFQPKDLNLTAALNTAPITTVKLSHYTLSKKFLSKTFLPFLMRNWIFLKSFKFIGHYTSSTNIFNLIPKLYCVYQTNHFLWPFLNSIFFQTFQVSTIFKQTHLNKDVIHSTNSYYKWFFIKLAQAFQLHITYTLVKTNKIAKDQFKQHKQKTLTQIKISKTLQHAVKGYRFWKLCRFQAQRLHYRQILNTYLKHLIPYNLTWLFPMYNYINISCEHRQYNSSKVLKLIIEKYLLKGK